MTHLELTTFIAAPPSACFDLSLNVDAHTNSMSGSGERAVAGTISGQLRHGDWVTWEARHFGVPLRMTVTISAHDRPHRFVDEQVAGPFARWRHEHRFEPVASGRTRMIDIVDFAAPLGPLGALAERAFLDRYMRRLIERRNAWLAAELGGR